MKRFLMAAVFLIALAACSSEPPSAPIAPVHEQVEAPVESPAVQAEATVGGEKRHAKWPLVPGWDTDYGPNVRVSAWFKPTRQDALMLQKAVDRFMEDGYPVYPNHPYAELNDAGRTIMDYMPRGGRLKNHYTGQESAVNSDCHAGMLGEICYMTIMDCEGYNVGYEITAMGAFHGEYLSVSYVDSSLIHCP